MMERRFCLAFILNEKKKMISSYQEPFFCFFFFFFFFCFVFVFFVFFVFFLCVNFTAKISLISMQFLS